MNKQKIILKWLNKEYGNLTIQDDGTSVCFLKNPKRVEFFYFKYDEDEDDDDGRVYFSHDRMWLLTKTIFDIGNYELKNILKIWLDETYNLKTDKIFIWWLSDEI
jgi:hypothetical protein